ncbi:MAG: hypothetical protein EPO21_18200 [Chloroflexota bacterium]|nr:MAG: hypothetical protein EPO21_18200 [Chloroflexota bacterium]
MPGFRVKGIHHTGVNVSDFERSLAFYRDALGFTVLWDLQFGGQRLSTITGLEKPHTRAALLDAGNQHIELFCYDAPPSVNHVARPCDVAITHMAIIVPDLQKTYAELSAQGTQFNCPPQLVKGTPEEPNYATYGKAPEGIVLEMMQVPGFGSQIHHNALNVTDFERSLSFYRDALGLVVRWDRDQSGEMLSRITGLEDPHARQALLSVGDQHIELFQYHSPTPVNHVARPCDVAITHIGLLVDDIQAAYAELSAKGMQFNCPPQLVRGGPQDGLQATYGHDPDGIILELMQEPS